MFPIFLHYLLFTYTYGKIKDILNTVQHGLLTMHSTVTQLVFFFSTRAVFTFRRKCGTCCCLFRLLQFVLFSRSLLSTPKLASFDFDEDFVTLLSSYLEFRRQKLKLGTTSQTSRMSAVLCRRPI